MAKRDEIVEAEVVDESRELDFIPNDWADVEEALGSLIEFEGSDYEVIDKAVLVGKPFLIVGLSLNPNGTYGEFATVRILTEDNRRVVINDGSSGIKAQVQELINKGHKAGIVIRRGLRVSEYEYQPVDFDGNPQVDPKTGEVKPAIPSKTYYFG